MKRSTNLKMALLVTLGFGAGIGVLGFRSASLDQVRPGLEAYRPTAIAAVPGAADADPSNSEVSVVLESRNVCRDVALRLGGSAKDLDALATSLRSDGERVRRAAAAGSPVDIDAFVAFALTRVDQARKEGSMGPLADFVKTECDPKQDYSQPILASER